MLRQAHIRIEMNGVSIRIVIVRQHATQTRRTMHLIRIVYCYRRLIVGRTQSNHHQKRNQEWRNKESMKSAGREREHGNSFHEDRVVRESIGCGDLTEETLLPMNVVRRLTFQEREDASRQVNAIFLHRQSKTGG